MTDARRALVLRVLAAAPGGLTVPLIMQSVPRSAERHRSAVLYDAALRQLAAAGLAEIAGKRPARRGPARNIWGITGAGMQQARQSHADMQTRLKLVQDAQRLLGPGTPPAIRRQAARTLRASGCSPGQISRAFRVSAATVSQDLRGTTPGPAPARTLAELAAQAATPAAHPRSSSTASLRAANQRRIAEATLLTADTVRHALARLPENGATLPPALREAARLRIGHPEASLTALAALASPPCTKDALAGRLRRVITSATLLPPSRAAGGQDRAQAGSNPGQAVPAATRNA